VHCPLYPWPSGPLTHIIREDGSRLHQAFALTAGRLTTLEGEKPYPCAIHPLDKTGNDEPPGGVQRDLFLSLWLTTAQDVVIALEREHFVCSEYVDFTIYTDVTRKKKEKTIYAEAEVRKWKVFETFFKYFWKNCSDALVLPLTWTYTSRPRGQWKHGGHDSAVREVQIRPAAAARFFGGERACCTATSVQSTDRRHQPKPIFKEQNSVSRLPLQQHLKTTQSLASPAPAPSQTLHGARSSLPGVWETFPMHAFTIMAAAYIRFSLHI
jgi:hypothetical protein